MSNFEFKAIYVIDEIIDKNALYVKHFKAEVGDEIEFIVVPHRFSTAHKFTVRNLRNNIIKTNVLMHNASPSMNAAFNFHNKLDDKN